MIKIRNIYYMLAYAFQVLNENGFKGLSAEKFENTAELFSAILTRGISRQIKQGLGREYISLTEQLNSPHGKINISNSIKTRAFLNKRPICDHDEFSVNSIFNRIIKATALLLLRSEISKPRKKELRSLLPYFSGVKTIDLRTVDWHFNFNKNNQNYRMLIAICWLTVKGLLQTQADGTSKLMDFLDEQRMHRLYEKFILEYFRREFPQLNARSSQIKWQLNDGNDELLPAMQSDVMLSHGNKFLIIDAKYYSHTTQQQFGKHTIHSHNLYQIFTYVKNKEYSLLGTEHEVTGMLLYARTDEPIRPDSIFQMSGNKIAVKTLDLNVDFAEIKRQLNKIPEEYLGIS